jgi:hypothetical protein
MSDVPAMIVAKDTDVFVLFAYGMSVLDYLPPWFMKVDANQFIDIKIVLDSLGREVCRALPQLHAITGCDTKFNTGKVRSLKKVLNDQSCLSLLSPLGQSEVVSTEVEENALKFLQTIVYAGKSNESYVGTRIRLYKNLKTKSSASLPADPDSIRQEIKRVHIQSYIWLHCLDVIIMPLDTSLYEWQVDGNKMAAVWFTGSQLPPSLRRQRAKVKINLDLGEGESDDEALSCRWRSKKRRLSDADIEMLNEPTDERPSDDFWESDFSEEYDNDSSDSDFLPKNHFQKNHH